MINFIRHLSVHYQTLVEESWSNKECHCDSWLLHIMPTD